ncbi:hypothetical protein IMAU20118_03560 [Lactiplantibacillus plantarum]|nr:hypothetical protein [Lactiplantibacillus plantarum]
MYICSLPEATCEAPLLSLLTPLTKVGTCEFKLAVPLANCEAPLFNVEELAANWLVPESSALMALVSVGICPCKLVKPVDTCDAPLLTLVAPVAAVETPLVYVFNCDAKELAPL